MLENQLKQLGFNKNESKVYLALFDLGKCKAGQIIDQTGLHRNLVYTALEDLVEKGLISKVDHGGVAMFSVNNPEMLQEMIKEKVNIASDIVNELKKKHEEQPRDIIIYEGDEGIKRSRNRVLTYEPGNTLYIIGSKASSTPEMEKYWRKFHTKRVEKEIGLKILYEQGVDIKDIEWRNKLPLSSAKYLPLNIDMPIWFSVIKDYLEIGIPGEEPLTFGLRSSAAAGAIQKFFEYFWNQEVSTETGVVALEKTIYEMLNELNPGEEYCVLGASAGDNNEEIQNLYDRFHTDRIKKGVTTKMLVYEESFQKIKKRFDYCGDPEGKNSLLKTYANTPKIPMQINTFHNKAFIILYGKEPTIIHFEQKEIHDGFKTYFDELWNQETQILKGIETLKELWLEGIKCKEIRWIGARAYFVDRYPEIWQEIKTKAEKTPGTIWKNIIDPAFEGHPLTKLPWMETKYNMDEIRNPTAIWLFGNKVLIVNWAEDIPVIFQSTNRHLVQSYSDYFEELWNKK